MKVRRDIDADEDCEPVIVPRNDKSLVAVAPERVRRLREHLIGTLREMRPAKPWVHSVSPALPDPTGFPARVAHTACSLCKGWCCRNGDDNGFLDEPTLARLCVATPGMTEGAILRLYLARVPPVAYLDSCIFHGKQGCTLDRSLRADIGGGRGQAGQGVAGAPRAFTTSLVQNASSRMLRPARERDRRSAPDALRNPGPEVLILNGSTIACRRYSPSKEQRDIRRAG